MNLTDNQSFGGAAGDTYSGVENVRGGGGNYILKPAKGGRAYGDKGNDIVLDSAGTEVLRGGKGKDTLSDAGAEDGLLDIFFLEPDNGLDTVVGFDQGTDLFWLSDKDGDGKLVSGHLLHNAQGQLAGGRVVNDSDMNGLANATQNYAQLIFDTQTKLLWYDKDGTGGAAAVTVARIDGFNGTLSTADFLVVPDV